MSIALDLFILIESFAMPTAQALSAWMGVGGCLWPKSFKMFRIEHPSFAL
jgi:hypothetical protein